VLCENTDAGVHRRTSAAKVAATLLYIYLRSKRTVGSLWLAATGLWARRNRGIVTVARDPGKEGLGLSDGIDVWLL